MPDPTPPPVLRSPELRALLVGRLVSLLGDQLGRVALVVLVFARTRSVPLAALAYAVTFLPAVVGGPLLGGLADRQPRRRVLVVADLLRAGVYALMAVPHVPLAVVLALVLVAGLADAPWLAARAALVRDVTGGDTGYARGTSIDEALSSGGQVLGYAVGGMLLTLLSARTALLLDAASFLTCAALLQRCVRARPAATSGGVPVGRRRTRLAVALADARSGWGAALAPGCRQPLLLTWGGLACLIAPEALAVPWATQLGAGARGSGLLLAAAPLGSVCAVPLLSRLPAPRGRRLLVPLALAGMLALAAAPLAPSLPSAIGLVWLSGAATAFSLLARIAFVAAVPDAVRGRAFSVASAGVTLTQGLGALLAGGLGAIASPAAAVSLIGLTGLVVVGLAARTGAQPAAVPEVRAVELVSV